MISPRKIKLLIGFMLAGMFCFAFAPHAFADPPSSPYAPGETLDPSCAPGSANCTVNPPLSATTTLTQGSVPFVGNASGTIYENNANFFWDNTADQLTVSNLKISGITGSTQCLHVNANGVVSGVGADCGTGGSGIQYLATSTAINVFTTEVNGVNATLTIPSNLGFFTNDVGYVTSTGITSYNVFSPNNFITVATTTNSAQLTFSSSSLDLGSASHYSFSDFLASSTGFVGSLASGTDISVSSATGSVTISFVNPGFASSGISITGGGILSGGGDLTANRVISLSTSTLNANVAALGFVTSTGMASYNVFSANGFISVVTSTNSAELTFSSSSLNLGSASEYAFSDFLASSTNLAPSTTIPTNYVGSFNGATGSVQGVGSFGNLTGTIALNASTGIAISTSSNIFSIQNTGVTSFNGGSGAVTGVGSISSGTFISATNATGSVTLNFINPGFVTAASSVTWTAAQTFVATATFQSSTILAFRTNCNILNTDASGSIGCNNTNYLTAVNVNGFAG
ncbi:MAG: hypothetical protein KGJ13_04070, partial [Patescibacteria group bacterium]|nr:hypothetical protein [Patescibacteria group bacterium]